MTITKKFYIATTLVGMLIAGVLLFAINPSFAGANPLAWLKGNANTNCAPTGASTSTLVYMTPGTATTTLSCDTYALGSGSQSLAPNKVLVRVHETASSTLSIQAVRFEWSDDNIDWYADSAITQTDVASSTYSVGDYKEYLWAYASTTPNGATIANATRGMRTFEVPVRGRYMRAIFYVPIGSLNSAIWAGVIANREEK